MKSYETLSNVWILKMFLQSDNVRLDTIRVFIKAQNWQYWHQSKLCTPTYLHLPSLFAPHYVSKYKLDVSGYKRILWLLISLVLFISNGKFKQSWQYWHPCIVDSLWRAIRIAYRFDANQVLNTSNAGSEKVLPWGWQVLHSQMHLKWTLKHRSNVIHRGFGIKGKCHQNS